MEIDRSDAHDLPDDRLPGQARKGRGAVTNRAGRYEPATTEAVDDGWWRDEDELPPLRTTVTVDTSRSIIAHNKSPDVPFDRSINPYRGCEHGCVYCFARPTHAWLGLSPGLDFESRLFVKPDAARLLEAELAKPGYRPAVIAMGTNTDPYQPLERERRITRQVLEVLSACNHPVGIVTKSALIERDLDLLADMARDNLVNVMFSVTTLDPQLARKLEPRAASPARRLAAMARLHQAGVPVGVLFAPLIPAINDHELERVLEASRQAGATQAGYVLLRLPNELKQLFADWLDSHFPDRAAHVHSLLRQMRGGALNDSQFGRRMRGQGVFADLYSQRLKRICARLGLNRERLALNTTAFRPPRSGTADSPQMPLF